MFIVCGCFHFLLKLLEIWIRDVILPQQTFHVLCHLLSQPRVFVCLFNIFLKFLITFICVWWSVICAWVHCPRRIKDNFRSPGARLTELWVALCEDWEQNPWATLPYPSLEFWCWLFWLCNIIWLILWGYGQIFCEVLMDYISVQDL